jgi:Mg2+-importing ATPase
VISRERIGASIDDRSARHDNAPHADVTLERYWTLTPLELARRLHSSIEGLSSAEAERRLQQFGPNTLRDTRPRTRLQLLLDQVRSPLLLLLVFAAAASLATREWIDAALVVSIVCATVAIGYWREYGAQAAVMALRARIHARAQVVRDGMQKSVAVEAVVPGDVMLLSAGSIVCGDGVLIESVNLFVSQAVLTGESFPAEKSPGIIDEAATLSERTNCVMLGTNVRSGYGRCLVVKTGASTQFAAIAHRLTLRPPETEFDRGVRRFGYLLMTAMLVMVLIVLVGHVFRGRPPVQTLLFAVALAVGLSPELLPAILSVSLARGARMMAHEGVLVRRLSAIENLGSMDVLCTDKTGTLTEGIVQVEGTYDPRGEPSPYVLALSSCNAALETGLRSPLDEAILGAHRPDVSAVHKLGEIPFDFVRKRVSVLVQRPDGTMLVTKGAFRQVMSICTRLPDGRTIDSVRSELERHHESWSSRGSRVLAVSTRRLTDVSEASRALERDMVFEGFVTFLDRPKKGVQLAIAQLASMGISVKLITGDSELVARHVAGLVGLSSERVLTGRDLDNLHDEALWHAGERTNLFVEVDPNQKERIILALKRMGHVVGFLGDGVNDAPAMHAADTSLSVDQAVDVAKEAADFVLLERGLDVIRRGVEEGRKTFANTLKYILITTSANLGNMVSMAAASLFLPFLPLLPGQILLNNFLSDIPAVGLADDSVDPEMIDQPKRWNIGFIARFMIVFGLISSVFDFVTFGLLQMIWRAAPELFRTGWFVESLLTELVIALVVRTRRPLFLSRPGRVLLVSTAGLIVLTFAVPFLPFAGVFGFVPVPGPLMAAICGITALYVMATEWMKRRLLVEVS